MTWSCHSRQTQPHCHHPLCLPSRHHDGFHLHQVPLILDYHLQHHTLVNLLNEIKGLILLRTHYRFESLTCGSTDFNQFSPISPNTQISWWITQDITAILTMLTIMVTNLTFISVSLVSTPLY